jgi:hypothetical protein
MISLRQPIRTLLFAVIVLVAAAVIRHRVEPPDGALTPEDEVTMPAVRTARQSLPTIVEPNENWMDSVPRTEATEAGSPLNDQQIPELPPTRKRTQRANVTR